MKEAKWTAGTKAIKFEEIAPNANKIKKITLAFGGNKFIADAKKGELIINGQINRFISGIPNPFDKKVKCKIDCWKRSVGELSTSAGGNKPPYAIAFLVGLIITVGKEQYVRYIIATDADKKKHEFQIISKR